MKELSIIKVLEDKHLLGQFLVDPKTWRGWFTFLKCFFALKPDHNDLELYKLCSERTVWPTEPSQEAWLVVGVRSGKSFTISLLATYLSIFRGYKLSPGEKGYVLIVAPTKKQSRIIKNYLSSFFNENDFLRPYLQRETAEEIELTNNIVICVLSSDYRSLRGYTAIASIVDEIAYLSIEGSRGDEEVIRALRGRLATTRGPLIAISSPYAKRGELYKAFQRHFGKDDSNTLVWRSDSITMNPTLNKDAIAKAYEEDPEGAKADFGGLFRSDIETFVSREAVEGCVYPQRYELGFVPGMVYRAFFDPSGGGQDSMTMCVGHLEDSFYIVDAIREVRPPFSPDEVCRDFSQLLRQYRISVVVGDRYGGIWPSERFKAHSITYEVAEKTKSDLYKELLPLINGARIELLDNERLITQLMNLERRTSRGGRDSIDHAPGSHDDLSNCVAGVAYEFSRKSERIFDHLRCGVGYGPKDLSTLQG